MENISASQAAKLLGISITNFISLEKQGLIHSVLSPKGVKTYSEEEILKIKSRPNQTLSDEAALVGVQIQREVVTSVSGLQKVLKRTAAFTLVVIGNLILSIVIIAGLFNRFPEVTSDFFGYYYSFNVPENSQVLAAATGPIDAAIKTSVLADVVKPVAGASLLLVKAADRQKYEQIVTSPALGTGQPGPKGADGTNGLPGLTGPIGPVGPTGPGGADGKDGASVADVMTQAGDIIVRDANNATTRLSAGLNNQVLTIASGTPIWKDLSIPKADLQHVATYDTNQALESITSSQVRLATISITPSTTTADVYVTGQTEIFSNSAADQPFTLVVETTADCTGTTVGNASVTYTITSPPSDNNLRGVLVVSGVDLNPGTSAKSYSLCASTPAGETEVQNWRLEALAID